MKNCLRLVVVLLLTVAPSVLLAESQSIDIKVRLDEKSISPVDPTLNLRTSDPVVLVHVLGVDQKKFKGMASYPDMTTYTRHETDPAYLIRNQYSRTGVLSESASGSALRSRSHERAFERSSLPPVGSSYRKLTIFPRTVHSRSSIRPALAG